MLNVESPTLCVSKDSRNESTVGLPAKPSERFGKDGLNQSEPQGQQGWIEFPPAATKHDNWIPERIRLDAGCEG